MGQDDIPKRFQKLQTIPLPLSGLSEAGWGGMPIRHLFEISRTSCLLYLKKLKSYKISAVIIVIRQRVSIIN